MGGTVSTAQTIGHTLAGVKPDQKKTKKGTGKKKQRITVMGNEDSKCPICATTNTIANSVYDLVNPMPKSAPKAKKDIVDKTAAETKPAIESAASIPAAEKAAAPIETAAAPVATAPAPAISN